MRAFEGALERGVEGANGVQGEFLSVVGFGGETGETGAERGGEREGVS